MRRVPILSFATAFVPERRSRSRPFRFAVCSVLMMGALLAQPARPVFEVASIRPSSLDANGATAMHEFSNGSVSVEATPRALILDAFQVMGYQVVGGPAWISTAYYNVTAKAEHPADASETWRMMTSLLEDRFHLKVHRENRQMSVYKLSVANGGLKLRECTCVSWAERTPEPPLAPGATFQLPCGRVTGVFIERGTGIEVLGGKIPMSSLADFLSHQLSQPVVDETGFKGTFDVHVKFSSDEAFHRLASDSELSGFPTVAGAMRELGIRMELVKAPVEVIVIDSIDRPDEN